MKKSDVKKVIGEVQAVERGALAPGRVWKVTKRKDGTVERKQIDPENYRRQQARDWKAKTEAAQVRHLVDLTQSAFAAMLGVSLGTVRKWESGAIEPSGAARTLLKIASRHPEIVREAANH